MSKLFDMTPPRRQGPTAAQMEQINDQDLDTIARQEAPAVATTELRALAPEQGAAPPAELHAVQPEPAPTTPETTTRKPTKSRKPKSRMRSQEPGTRVAVYLPPDLEIDLRVHCAKNRQSLSDAISDAVSRYVSR